MGVQVDLHCTDKDAGDGVRMVRKACRLLAMVLHDCVRERDSRRAEREV